MTTNLVLKFKEFMKDLGMWEAFVNTYQVCQPSFGPNAKNVDEYLLSCTSSDVFSLVLFSNEGEWKDLSELWKIELSKENASSAVPAKMDDKQLAFTSTISGYKFCTRCYQLKKTFYFNKEKSRNDGLSPYCKDCTNGTVSQGTKKVMNIHTAVYSQNRIFLSQQLTACLEEKGIKCCKAINRKGHLFLVFTQNSNNKNLKHYKHADACSVSDIDITKTVCRFFKISIEDAFYLHLSKNTSKKEDIFTIEVMKIYTPEVYDSIRFINKDSQPLMAQRKNDSTLVVSKTWEDMTDDERYNYIAKNFHDPDGIIPDDWNLIDTYCDHFLSTRNPDANITKFETKLASTLVKAGWKLHKPVKTIKYEEFTI